MKVSMIARMCQLVIQLLRQSRVFLGSVERNRFMLRSEYQNEAVWCARATIVVAAPQAGTLARGASAAHQERSAPHLAHLTQIALRRANRIALRYNPQPMDSTIGHSHLFQPLTLKSVTLRNRIGPAPGPGTASAASRAKRASNPENQFSVRLFLTAIASALRCPMSTTSFLPRVMPHPSSRRGVAAPAGRMSGPAARQAVANRESGATGPCRPHF
jgi:hypothetical protein